MSGLFVAVFPRSSKLALILHGELQLHMHGLGLSGGCFFFVCVCSLQWVCSTFGSTNSGGSASLTH